MSFTAYQITVPAYLRGLTVLGKLLGKAEAHAAETGTSLQDLVDARLAPDMYTLAGQIQRSSDAAKLGVVRLTGLTAPVFEDTEASFPELHERLAKTIAWIESVDPAVFDGAEARTIELKTPNATLTWTGADFITQFALPNFYFHVTAAYAILRNAGVPLGKRDFLGG